MIRYFDLFFFMLYVQSSLDNIVYENIVYKVIVYKVLCCKPIRAKFVLVLSLKVEQYIHTYSYHGKYLVQSPSGDNVVRPNAKIRNLPSGQ